MVVEIDMVGISRVVANYHKKTIESLVEMIVAAGLKRPSDIQKEHILHRTDDYNFVTYAD